MRPRVDVRSPWDAMPVIDYNRHYLHGLSDIANVSGLARRSSLVRARACYLVAQPRPEALILHAQERGAEIGDMREVLMVRHAVNHAVAAGSPDDGRIPFQI